MTGFRAAVGSCQSSSLIASEVLPRGSSSSETTYEQHASEGLGRICGQDMAKMVIKESILPGIQTRKWEAFQVTTEVSIDQMACEAHEALRGVGMGGVDV